MKTILLNCCYISPFRGSEWSVAWNHVVNMSRYCKLVVLYGASGSYIGENEDMKKWLDNNKLENVEFVYVQPTKLTIFGEYLNKKGFIYAHFPAIRLWQREAYKKAKEITSNQHIDIVHHLGPIGFREPGYLWKLNKPYVWGALGGFAIPDKRMTTSLPVLPRIKLLIRKLSRWIQSRFDKRVIGAMNHADVIIAATKNTARLIETYYKRSVEYIPENCMRQLGNICNNRFESISILNIMMAGRFDVNKNNILLLKAIAEMKYADKVHVDLVGDGPMRSILERYIADNKLSDIVTIRGMMPRDKVQEIFDNAHLHVITSYFEGNPTVIWEAMEHGVPTLTVNHCGMADVVDEFSGIKVPVDTERNMVAVIADELDNLVQNPQKLKQLSDGTVARAKLYQWDGRCRQFLEFYEKAEKNFNDK